MAALQSRERRLLLVGGLIAVGVLGYIYGVEPLVQHHRDTLAQIASREQLLQRQERLLARRDRYREEREALQAEVTRRRGRLLPGDKAPLAASELQKLVKSIALDTGVEVRSERVLPTTDRGGYVEVPVEVTLAGPIRSLVTFLSKLEAVPAQVGIQDLKIRVASVAAPRELLTTLQLTGYIASGSSGEPTPPSRSEPRRSPGA
jgi:type IV pilus assembly protein PilO